MKQDILKFALNQANNMLVQVLNLCGESMAADSRKKLQNVLTLLEELNREI